MDLPGLPWFAILVVAALTLVQSVFGVGLLVFGTPTLLLAGVEFDRALALLLPASLCVSAAQLFDPLCRKQVRWRYLAWSLPFMVAALAGVLFFEWTLNMRRTVGLMLLLTAALRLHPLLQRLTRAFLVKNQNVYLAAMGFVHGLSNMGGGLLTIFANSLHPEKNAARANVAAVYLVFALCQMMILGALKPGVLDLGSAASAAVAAAVYALLGNRIFHLASNLLYQSLISVLLLAYGCALIY